MKVFTLDGLSDVRNYNVHITKSDVKNVTCKYKLQFILKYLTFPSIFEICGIRRTNDVFFISSTSGSVENSAAFGGL